MGKGGRSLKRLRSSKLTKNTEALLKENKPDQSTEHATCFSCFFWKFKPRERNSRLQHGSASPEETTETEQSLPKFVDCEDGLFVGEYECKELLGRGSFGYVFLCEKDENQFALKILSKSNTITSRQKRLTKGERDIMVQCGDHPSILGLHEAFQTATHLCLVSDVCSGGELFFHLEKAGRFNEQRVMVYAAEIASALNFLHFHGIAYRDLKAENILLDVKGHIKLADFGLASVSVTEWRGASSVCGTPAYISPDMIFGGGALGPGYGHATDWWSLGALMYDMLVGNAPFYHDELVVMCDRIMHSKLRFPESRNISPKARSVIEGLLNKVPSQRLGTTSSGGFDALKEHPFFEGIDWDSRQVPFFTTDENQGLINSDNVEKLLHSNFHKSFWSQNVRTCFQKINKNVLVESSSYFPGWDFVYISNSDSLTSLDHF